MSVPHIGLVKQTRQTQLLESSAIVLQSEAFSIEKAIKSQNLIALYGLNKPLLRSGRRDLNPRPLAPHASALPSNYGF